MIYAVVLLWLVIVLQAIQACRKRAQLAQLQEGMSAILELDKMVVTAMLRDAKSLNILPTVYNQVMTYRLEQLKLKYTQDDAGAVRIEIWESEPQS